VDYVKAYDKLIARARGRKRHGYMERHHVVPKCMGGQDAKENFVFLTAKEHFIAHKLLARIHPEVYGLWQAVVAMGRLAGYKSRIFASERARAAALRRNFRYSEESKRKMSASAKERGRNAPQTEFVRGQTPWNAGLPKELSHRYGKKHSAETIERMRASQQAVRAEQSARMKLWWRERKAAAQHQGAVL
jgi:hypothetical protein